MNLFNFIVFTFSDEECKLGHHVVLIAAWQRVALSKFANG